MARILPFYRTGGLLSGGGGGGALGDATVWPAVADWASLGTIAGPLRVGDRVEVSDLQPGLAYAARYSGGGGWELAQAVFPTVADLLAFPEPIFISATAIVGTGIETDPMYYYDGSNWQRMADGVPFAWSLTETQLLEGTDPSGIGAVQDGDYGTFTPAGGAPIVVRYNAAVTRAAGAGGGTAPAWLPPEVYAGSPTLEAYLVGTESVTTDVTLNAQGWGTVTRTNGTITSQTTRVRLATTAASALAGIDTLTSGVTSSTRIYARLLWRAAVGSGTTTAATGVYMGQLRDGANGIQASYFSAATASGTFFWTGSGTTNGGISQTSQAAIPGLSGTDDLIENYYDIAANVSELRRNGITTASSLRSISSADADRFRLVAWSGSAATQTSTMDVSQVQVFTW
jgi:hypothetical protein